ASGHPDASEGAIRALAIGADGQRLFANRACDRADFPVNSATEGDQRRPTLTTLAGGDVLVAWTDDGPGADSSGSHVMATVLTREALFPSDKLPTAPGP